MLAKHEFYRKEIIEELALAYQENSDPVDILMVVHDQPDYVSQCLTSLAKNTRNFNLYVWDNASTSPTRDLLRDFRSRGIISELVRSDTNVGFIKSNNRLAELTRAPYIALLNSDTYVLEGWMNALVNGLKQDPGLGQVGYMGAKFRGEIKGGHEAYGRDVDFLCGWCFCIPRTVYERVGLFDEENLEFAYGEDSDLSLRIREAGFGIRSLHLDLVYHYGNRTVVQVREEMDITESFARNHEYLNKRWGHLGKTA